MKLNNNQFVFSLFLTLTLLSGCEGSKNNKQAEIKQTESLQEIAYDAFIYAYPLMEQVKTVNGMFQFMGLKPNQPAMNPKYPQENVGMPIVAPNLTSMTGGIFIDIANGPVTLEVPTVKDRYMVLQCIDVFTHNFYYIGTRATQGEGGQFVFYRQGQNPPASAATPVLVEGDHAIIVVRIDIKDESELEKVRSIQAGIKIVGAPAENREYPQYDEKKAFSPAFVEYINALLTEVPATEEKMFRRFARIGIMSDVQLNTL